MKAILEFDLNEINDEYAHRRAISSTDAYLVILDMSRHLRDKIKYGDLPDDVASALEEVREYLFIQLSNRNVNIDDLQ